MTYVITNDGKKAWQWSDPTTVIYFESETEVKEFIADQQAKGSKIVDDRTKEPETYDA